MDSERDDDWIDIVLTKRDILGVLGVLALWASFWVLLVCAVAVCAPQVVP